MKLATSMLAVILAVLTFNFAEARGGRCDGIHGCICGSTQARHFGLPRMYNGHNLWEAREWAYAFPRTSCSPGAVVVWPHHVARIVSCEGRGVITDETGTYTPRRNIHSAVFVAVNGGGYASASYERPRHSTRVASRHGHHHRYRVAQRSTVEMSADRLTSVH